MTTNFGDASKADRRRYHPLVAGDLADATRHYDNISNELGNRFRASVRDRIEAITERPDSFGQIHEMCRAAMLNHFPYVILFEREKQVIRKRFQIDDAHRIKEQLELTGTVVEFIRPDEVENPGT